MCQRTEPDWCHMHCAFALFTLYAVAVTDAPSCAGRTLLIPYVPGSIIRR